MKTTVSKIVIVLLVLTSVLTMAASPNNNRIKITYFTGSEQFDHVIDPGITKVVGGKTITKGLVVFAIDSMSDPRVSGEVTTTVDSVYKGPAIFGTGPLWGTIHLSNGDGEWNIRFTGHQYENCLTVIHGHGSGMGAYKGLKAVWESHSSNCMLTVDVSGYIIEH